MIFWQYLKRSDKPYLLSQICSLFRKCPWTNIRPYLGPKLRSFYLLFFKYFFWQNAQFWKLEEITPIFSSFSWDVFSFVSRFDQSRASENIWWIISKVIEANIMRFISFLFQKLWLPIEWIAGLLSVHHILYVGLLEIACAQIVLMMEKWYVAQMKRLTRTFVTFRRWHAMVTSLWACPGKAPVKVGFCYCIDR